MSQSALEGKLNEHVKGSLGRIAASRALTSQRLLLLTHPVWSSTSWQAQCPCLAHPAAGLTKVEMVMSKENPGLSRGFCFAEFYNHAAAAAAKNALSAPDFR